MSDFFQSLGNPIIDPNTSPEDAKRMERQWVERLTPENEAAAQYGGMLRGQAGARYSELGGLAEAADRRNIGMTMGEQMAMNDLAGSRGMQAESLGQWRNQALGLSPSMAQAEAARQAASTRGALLSGAASARGGAAAASFAQRQAMNAGTMAEGDIMSRGNEAALMERERARAAYLENAGQLRGMEQGLYGAEMGRTMTGARLNDARSIGLLGMQEGVADAERKARQDWQAMYYGQTGAMADATARAQEASARRNDENTRMGIQVGAGVATGGAGALAHMGSSQQAAAPRPGYGASQGAGSSGGAGAAGSMFAQQQDDANQRGARAGRGIF